MAVTPVPDAGAAPTIPARVRSWVYMVSLCAAGLGSIVTGIAGVVAPEAAATVAGVVGAVLGGVGIVSSGLGVVYRPAALLPPRE